MAKGFNTSSGTPYFGRSTIRSTSSLKAAAPAKAVPPSVRPLKTTYSKMNAAQQPFGGFGSTGLEETPSILGMSKGHKLIKSQMR